MLFLSRWHDQGQDVGVMGTVVGRDGWAVRLGLNLQWWGKQVGQWQESKGVMKLKTTVEGTGGWGKNDRMEGTSATSACTWATGRKAGNCSAVFAILDDTFANQYLQLLLPLLELQHYKSQWTWKPCSSFLLFIGKYEHLCSEVIFECQVVVI